MQIRRKYNGPAALILVALLVVGGLRAESTTVPETENASPSTPASTPSNGKTDSSSEPSTVDSGESSPSTLELHHARIEYRELYSLSQDYRHMLNVLDENFGSPSNLTSGKSENNPGEPVDAETEPPKKRGELSDCPANAYLHYSRNEIPSALNTVRSCIQKQREALSAYGRAMSENTDIILGRLSDRIQGLMGESQFSSTSISSRKLNKGRNLLKLSLKTAQQAEGLLQEKPEAAIQRLRVARFQAIQGLILLEDTYAGEQELKKEFETALLDAEGKVHIRPLDESKYPKARKEEPADQPSN